LLFAIEVRRSATLRVPLRTSFGRQYVLREDRKLEIFFFRSAFQNIYQIDKLLIPPPTPIAMF
jgi:hypothetical protein